MDTRKWRQGLRISAYASLVALSACQVTPQNGASTKSTAAGLTQDAGNAPGVLAGTSWLDANAARMTVASAASLFLDTYDATAASSQTACANLFGAHGANVVPWPADLKSFLATEIRRLPQLAALRAKSLHGLYYVNNFPVSNGAMTCNDPNTGLVYVLFNSKAMQDSIADTHADLQRVTTQSIFVDASNTIIDLEPNYLVSLMFHELFHVVDYTYFLVNGGATDWQAMTPARQQIMALSWTQDGKNKYPVAGVGASGAASSTVATAASSSAGGTTSSGGPGVAAGPQTPPAYTCALPAKPTTFGSGGKSFGFTTSVPQSIAQAIAATNFLDDYSMDSDREDWAQTLALYFMATRYGEYPSYVVYDRQVVSGQTAGAVKVFNFDALDLMRNDSLHRSKVCLLAQTVFGEDCSKTLADIPAEQ